MYKFLLTFFVLISTPSFAFEIKPEAHNSMEWNKNPDLKREIDKNCEDDTCYKVFSAMPVHEIITAEATKSFCKHYEKTESFRLWGLFNNECNNLKQEDHAYSSNDPLISGVEFNDDPTGILRRDHYMFFNDYPNARLFEKTLKKIGTLTNSSHYGESQFLHAMASLGDEKPTLTQKRIIDYVAENFNLAREIDLKIKSADFYALEKIKNATISNNDTYKFLTGYEGECEYDDFIENNNTIPRKGMNVFKLLQRCGQLGYGEYPNKDEFNKATCSEKITSQSRTTGLLLLGSALHVIQDSYSTSHTKRDDKTRNIIKFYHYPNNYYELSPPLHCEHDQFAIQNQDAIQTATEKSRDFLIQFAEMDCDSSEGEANTCKDKIKTWLKTNIFDLEVK